MLTGDWDQDLLDWMSMHLDPSRLTVLGGPDTSSNAMKQACRLQSITYREPPTIGHPSADLAPLATAIEQAGLWTKMKRVQYLTLGMREMLLRPDVDQDGVLTIRQVYPHNVIAWARADRPDVPVIIWELRQRELDGADVYAWDQLDISDPEKPVMQVVTATRGTEQEIDITEKAYGKASLSGENYPYRRRDGALILPYAWYHAEDTGCLWDPYFDREVLRGTLTSAMLQTFVVRAARDVTGNTVLGFNCNFGALQTTNQGTVGAARTIALEPGSYVEVMPKSKEGGESWVEVVPPGADLAEIGAQADSYEKRTLYRAGVKPPDPTAQHGDARSGYALALDDRGRREVAQGFEPMFRRGDLQTLMICSVLLNSEADAEVVPEDGHTIRYAPIPYSPEEERERRERLTWEYAAGIIEGWELVMAYVPGISEDEAKKRAKAGDLARLLAGANGAAGQNGRGAVATLPGAATAAPEAPPESTDNEATSPDTENSEETPAPAGPAKDLAEVKPGAKGQPSKVSDVMPNGAQLDALGGYMDRVVEGKWPKASVVRMMVSLFRIDQAEAEAIMAPFVEGSAAPAPASSPLKPATDPSEAPAS